MLTRMRIPPLSAGQLDCRIALQARTESIGTDNVITSTWSTIDTVWAAKRYLGLVAPVDGELAAARRRWELTIRRRKTTPVAPLRVLYRDQTLFAIAVVDNDADHERDRTTLECVDGLDLSATASGVETVTIYRGTDVPQTDRSTVRTWAPAATGVRIRLEESDATLLARLFGSEIAAELRGTVGIEADLRLDDGITVTAGRHATENYRVTGRRIDPRLPAEAYYALALTRTREAFV